MVILDAKKLNEVKDSLRAAARRRTEIGIFRDASHRTPRAAKMTSGLDLMKSDELNNAELGYVHEFGHNRKRIPERSFLRMPLTTELGPRIEAKSDTYLDVIINDSPADALALIGVEGEQVIREAFDSAGFGRWKPIKRSTARRKGHSAILLESKQLRDSISSRLK